MAWTSPRTWVALETITAALLNTHLRDNLSYLYARLVLQRLSVTVVPVSNSGTAETDTMWYVMPGGTLSADGMAIEVVAYGTSANNGNTKTVRLYFGATKVLEFTVAASATPWRATMHVARTGAATQVATADATGTTGTGVLGGGAAPAETLSGDVVVRVTAQSDTAGSDLTQTYFGVRLVP